MTTRLIIDTPRFVERWAARDANARIVRRADAAVFTEMLIQVLK